MTTASVPAARAAAGITFEPLAGLPPLPPRVILSFDVEEHHRIEAAAGLSVEPSLKAEYARRMDYTTRWLLDRLGERGIRATFFVVGEVARHNPSLVRAIHRGGHEVANHSWDHRRVHRHTPRSFREDVRRTNHALAQLTGTAVVGYRAPTFSIVRQTAWALGVLAELGMAYDSSVYPVRHDRYGVPEAPRAPSVVRTGGGTILEIPPASLRLGSANLPVGGGGYFRLLPRWLLGWGLRQTARECRPPVAMLYFHPWEFDADQPRLPLGRLSRFRTYVGLASSRGKWLRLLQNQAFVRSTDVAEEMLSYASLPQHACDAA